MVLIVGVRDVGAADRSWIEGLRASPAGGAFAHRMQGGRQLGEPAGVVAEADGRPKALVLHDAGVPDREVVFVDSDADADADADQEGAVAVALAWTAATALEDGCSRLQLRPESEEALGWYTSRGWSRRDGSALELVLAEGRAQPDGFPIR